jgi:hypothetical protein
MWEEYEAERQHLYLQHSERRGIWGWAQTLASASIWQEVNMRLIENIGSWEYLHGGEYEVERKHLYMQVSEGRGIGGWAQTLAVASIWEEINTRLSAKTSICDGLRRELRLRGNTGSCKYMRGGEYEAECEQW